MLGEKSANFRVLFLALRNEEMTLLLRIRK